MRYSIQRECWNDKTYNGFSDNPYWLIRFDNYQIGLSDNGTYWCIDGSSKTPYIKEMVETIISECKLQINLVD